MYTVLMEYDVTCASRDPVERHRVEMTGVPAYRSKCCMEYRSPSLVRAVGDSQDARGMVGKSWEIKLDARSPTNCTLFIVDRCCSIGHRGLEVGGLGRCLAREEQLDFTSTWQIMKLFLT